jgi:hypothetical protein
VCATAHSTSTMSRQPSRGCYYRGVPKRQFATEQEARDLDSRPREQQPYLCGSCGHWHLGKYKTLEQRIARVSPPTKVKKRRR